MPLALFGITDETVNLVVNLVIVFLAVLWLALVAWTFFDARRRIEDPVLVAFATAASLFPYVGTMVYSILRPPEYIEDRHERDLEIRAAELRVRQLEEQSCPNCEHPIERTFLRCPSCRARIKHPCPTCSEPVDPRWSVCPYCETPLRRVASERRPAPAAEGAGRADAYAESKPASVPRSQRPQRRKAEQPAKARAGTEQRAKARPADERAKKPRSSDEQRTKPRSSDEQRTKARSSDEPPQKSRSTRQQRARQSAPSAPSGDGSQPADREGQRRKEERSERSGSSSRRTSSRSRS